MDNKESRRPAEQTEHVLINAILEGRYPVGSKLPGERELATTFGVTRPTLRETLARLSSDGWIRVAHGKATVVNDYWRDGGLNVLCAILRSGQPIDPQFVTWLLQIRLDLAPAYTGEAVTRDPQALIELLDSAATLEEKSEAYSAFDWQVHYLLTIASGNPVYTLILNGFRELYAVMGTIYFGHPAAQAASRAYYHELRDCCQRRDSAAAIALTHETMTQSLHYWKHLQGAL